jgi:hypothetical protein
MMAICRPTSSKSACWAQAVWELAVRRAAMAAPRIREKFMSDDSMTGMNKWESVARSAGMSIF